MFLFPLEAGAGRLYDKISRCTASFPLVATYKLQSAQQKTVSLKRIFTAAPFIIADIPLSFVADTILLPWGLSSEPEMEREAVIFSSEECMDVMNPG